MYCDKSQGWVSIGLRMMFIDGSFAVRCVEIGHHLLLHT